jgi:transcriptional regulator with XRE-family HTH domain
MSQEALAAAAGLSAPQVSRYETGATSPFAKGIHQLAAALNLPDPGALVGQRPSEARLLGEVGAGAEVFPLDEDGDRFPAPPGLEAPVAVRVTGTSMNPAYRAGDILYAEEVAKVCKDVVGQDCILQCEDGRRLVKRVLRGGEPGTFRLFSYETGDLSDDVRLLWAAPVRWVQRG